MFFVTARIGPRGCNAGFADEYQDADWIFCEVTRNTEEPGTSPHELPTYQNIRIFAFEKSSAAAIFARGHNNAKPNNLQ